MKSKNINLDYKSIGNDQPLILIGGLNVIEDKDLTLNTAKRFQDICKRIDIPFIFKASYDKANRSSINSFRGPGLKKGLKILEEIKESLGVKILTDVHSPEEAMEAGKICDVIQLPAFLARQTDLVKAMAETNCVINIKKPQFISPEQIKYIVEKFKELGNNKILICERGSNFGYDNLVVDMLGFGVMKKECDNLPIIFDVTHSLQRRSPGEDCSGGRRSQLPELARAGVSTKIAGLFIEAHPEPSKALCDGPSALPLDLLEQLLFQLTKLDKLVKSFEDLTIN